MSQKKQLLRTPIENDKVIPLPKERECTVLFGEDGEVKGTSIDAEKTDWGVIGWLRFRTA